MFRQPYIYPEGHTFEPDPARNIEDFAEDVIDEDDDGPEEVVPITTQALRVLQAPDPTESLHELDQAVLRGAFNGVHREFADITDFEVRAYNTSVATRRVIGETNPEYTPPRPDVILAATRRWVAEDISNTATEHFDEAFTAILGRHIGQPTTQELINNISHEIQLYLRGVGHATVSFAETRHRVQQRLSPVPEAATHEAQLQEAFSAALQSVPVNTDTDAYERAMVSAVIDYMASRRYNIPEPATLRTLVSESLQEARSKSGLMKFISLARYLNSAQWAYLARHITMLPTYQPSGDLAGLRRGILADRGLIFDIYPSMLKGAIKELEEMMGVDSLSSDAELLIQAALKVYEPYVRYTVSTVGPDTVFSTTGFGSEFMRAAWHTGDNFPYDLDQSTPFTDLERSLSLLNHYARQVIVGLGLAQDRFIVEDGHLSIIDDHLRTNGDNRTTTTEAPF